jgi:hypothetical protein
MANWYQNATRRIGYNSNMPHGAWAVISTGVVEGGERKRTAAEMSKAELCCYKNRFIADQPLVCG